ncbi:hypothetical protein [Mangrovicoccus ximenensis]|uniref:hypothetical protein n=1 Tax=Mangrovicoccus ximenensis TaxID=1911570 RepID=UPI000D381D37|nr:hypothetical protein [Mangrovicoccus ximenensis]
MTNDTNGTKHATQESTHNEPSAEAWRVADKLWDILEKMDRKKARTIVTSLTSACPNNVEYAKNLIKEYEGA